jgi:phenylacetate-coenzyme A ligase PaaK-like adenylate-forming protein
MKNAEDEIFSIHNEKSFGALALEVFKTQYNSNSIYRQYADLMKFDVTAIDHYSKIPFLPVEFFKSHEVVTAREHLPAAKKTVFTSSGTTGQIPSRHIVNDLALYEKSFIKCFELFYGNPADFSFLFLLPSYLERSGSSLVYMAEKLVELSKHHKSAFYLHNLDELAEAIHFNKSKKQITFLFGVTYALLDLAEKNISLDENFIVVETGGMKGQRAEMLKEELHAILSKKFGVEKIHSEYGMTELLSQGWSKGDGIFQTPPWMKILIRDPYDPLELFPIEKTGAVNIIDLANINSCSFIATSDLGKVYADESFEIMGRMDDAELRGCNLMIQ